MNTDRRVPLDRVVTLLRLTYQEFSQVKKNWGLLLFGIAYIIFYQTRQFSEDRVEIASDAIIFSTSVTETIQVFV